MKGSEIGINSLSSCREKKSDSLLVTDYQITWLPERQGRGQITQLSPSFYFVNYDQAKTQNGKYDRNTKKNCCESSTSSISPLVSLFSSAHFGFFTFSHFVLLLLGSVPCFTASLCASTDFCSLYYQSENESPLDAPAWPSVSLTAPWTALMYSHTLIFRFYDE